MKKLFILLICLFPIVACAKPQTLSWSWPTTSCDGEALAMADWNRAELAYDVNPMPMPSDSGDGCASVDPDAPAAATVVPITTPVTSVELNLMPGMTYYARIRVCYYGPTVCSSWSSQHQFVVPYGKPNKAIWIN